MLAELDLLLNYKLSKHGNVEVAIHKDLLKPNSPYKIEFGTDVERVLPPQVFYKPRVIVDPGSPKQADKSSIFGQLETKNISEPFRARLFGKTLYQHFLSKEKETGSNAAREWAQKQIVLTLLHERFHYAVRFLNNSVVGLAYAIIPELSDLLTSARVLSDHLDEEEVFCEFMAYQEAIKIEASKVAVFRMCDNR